jgi:hypothetical protein
MNIHRLAAVSLIVFISQAWGDDFRKSDWGATPGDVEQQEEAESLGRKDEQNGMFALVFSEAMFGHKAEIRYHFDAHCERLYFGSFSFEESLPEASYIGIMQTFSNIYGEPESHSFVYGGSLYTWKNGESSIQLMHLLKGIDVPELADRPRTSISYWYRYGKLNSCGLPQVPATPSAR